jgi:hypothetical protein
MAVALLTSCIARRDFVSDNAEHSRQASATESTKSSSNTDLSVRDEADMGFDTPEDAVWEYVDGLKNADLDRMIGAFAIETYIENASLEKSLERVRAYLFFSSDINMPNSNEFVTALNIENRRKSVNE